MFVLRWHTGHFIKVDKTWKPFWNTSCINFFQIGKYGVLKILVLVYIIGDSPSFLSALAFNNAFIIKMWPSGTIDMVVRTLEISFDQFIIILEKEEFHRVM